MKSLRMRYGRRRFCYLARSSDRSDLPITCLLSAEIASLSLDEPGTSSISPPPSLPLTPDVSVTIQLQGRVLLFFLVAADLTTRCAGACWQSLKSPAAMTSTEPPQQLPAGSASFLHESEDDFARLVLQLARDETESSYEQSLQSQAREYGVPLASQPNPDLSHPQHPAPSTSRQSVSTTSRNSFASDLTFDLAPRPRSRYDKHRAIPNGRRGSETSSSTRDYDSVLGHARPNGWQTFNQSPPKTPSPSSVSIAHSAPAQPSSRKQFIRGLSRLKLRRSESGGSNKR